MSLGEYLGAGNGVTKGLYHLNGNANDSSGNSNNGTATGVSWVNGKLGSGAVSFGNGFDQRTQYITLPVAVRSTNQTIAFCIKSTASTSQWYMLVYSDESAGQIHSRVTIGTSSGTPNNIEFRIGAATPTVATSSNSFARDGVWRCFVLTRSLVGSTYTAKIYCNGVECASASANSTSVSPGASPVVGAASVSGGGFNGQIDELIIEDRVWTPEEIKKYVTYANGKFGIL